MSNEIDLIARVINQFYQIPLECSSQWEVLSSQGPLRLIHYKSEANLQEVGRLRGVVVDVEAKCVVCDSHGYTPIVTLDQLKLEDDGSYHLVDIMGITHKLNGAKCKMFRAFEGTVLRVFYHKNTMYVASHKRLDTVHSCWGNSRSFRQMYDELGGPQLEDLFNPLTAYSPYCHIFIVVHPEVLIATKQNVGRGFLIYLGPQEMWSLEVEKCPYRQTDKTGKPLYEEGDQRPLAGYIDPKLYLPETVQDWPGLLEPEGPEQGENFIYHPSSIDVQEANHHLEYGFYHPNVVPVHDPRAGTGEAIIIQYQDEQGKIQHYKIQSSAYSYRVSLRGNNPNLENQFYYLANDARFPREMEPMKILEHFIVKYPLYRCYSPELILKSMEEDGPFITWPLEFYAEPGFIMSYESRLYLIHIAFLMAVPLHRQREVWGYLEQYYQNREKVAQWLQNYQGDPALLSRRAQNILQEAHKGAQQQVFGGKAFDYRGIPMEFKQLVNNNIRNFILKEGGNFFTGKERNGSLYRLVQEMKGEGKRSIGEESSTKGPRPLTLADFLPEAFRE